MTSNPNARFPAIAALAAQLADERLTDAACAGLAPLFDADTAPGESDPDRDARHADAVAVCGRCPVRGQCATAAAELGALARGVWAGQVHADRRRGRPKAGQP